MKIDTFKRFDYTVDLWAFTISRDTEGGAIFNYTFDRTLNVRVATSTAGRLFVYFKPEDSDAVTNCQLVNLRYPNGDEIRPNGVWELTSSEPIINMWGQAEGYKGTAAWVGIDNSGVI